MAVTYPPSLTDQDIADYLTRTGDHWSKTSITISFNNYSTSGNELDATQQTWIRLAVGQIAEILDIDFTFLSSGELGDITFNGSSGNGTYATNLGEPYSDIFIDQSWVSNQSANLAPGNYGPTTFMHEFLHALGLPHPGDYNVTANYFTDADFRRDTRRYTIMSYFEADEDGSGTSHYAYDSSLGYYTWRYAQTPMVYDILALTSGSYGGLFSGYGFNTTTRSGDSTYGYNISGITNQTFDFTVNTAPIITIYDAGGIDTLDLSGDTVSTKVQISYDANGIPSPSGVVSRTGSIIDLREGHYSSTHGMDNNIGIAFGTVIENAIGTQFNDTMYGNDVGNILQGGAGADSLFGFLGNDTLDGGTGTNTIDGGSGWDIATFSFTYASASIVHNPDGTWTISNGGTSTTLTNVELARFSDRDVSLRLSPHHDMDGSNTSDILWRNSATGENVIWSISSGGTVAAAIRPGNVGAGWEAAGIGDFNGDGIADILWRNSSTGVNAIWKLNEDGEIGSTIRPGGVGSGWDVAGIGDFNGDGISDILWRNSATGVNSIWMMDENGEIGSAVRPGGVGSNWEAAGIGDFNGDGISDILWRNSVTGVNAIWMLNENGGIDSTVRPGGLGSNWESAGIGDFNGDGIADILWRNDSTGENVIWLMDSSGNKSSAVRPGNVGGGWEVAGIGDFNGDGISDIFWRNQGTGENSIWMMTSTGNKGSAVRPGGVGSGWTAF